jgi:hypothetical protein
MPRKRAPLKLRTPLTLPADSLLQAEKIARSRQVNLSTVISEAVLAGLQIENARNRRDRILDDYKKMFTGFSPEELAILDSVILEPARRG